MRLALLIALLALAAAAVDFGVRGLAAIERAGHEAQALAARADLPELQLADATLPSRARVAELARWRDDLARIAGDHRVRLLDDTRTPPPPRLEVLLPRWPGLPLGDADRAAIAADGRVDAAFARLLQVLDEAAVQQVESLRLQGERTPTAVNDVPGLAALSLALQFVAEPQAALAALEGLVPGQGEPVLVIDQATIHRLEPETWERLPGGLTDPPVRLRVQLRALFGVVADGR